jgi:uncharacterized protein YggU (UPF0235/DUF167 family)
VGGGMLKFMFIKVFVTPGAKKDKVEERDGVIHIATREPASGNRANLRVRELVAERFGKPLSSVRILTGHRARGKMVSISS